MVSACTEPTRPDRLILERAPRRRNIRCGARPRKRVIQRSVQYLLAEMILAGDVHDGSQAKIAAGKRGLTFQWPSTTRR